MANVINEKQLRSQLRSIRKEDHASAEKSAGVAPGTIDAYVNRRSRISDDDLEKLHEHASAAQQERRGPSASSRSAGAQRPRPATRESETFNELDR